MRAPALGQMRFPCAGLLLAAMAGIVVSRITEISSGPWLALFFIAAFLSLWDRTRHAVWIMVVSAFALLQIWQGFGSAGARLAGGLTGSWMPVTAGIEVDSIPRESGGGRSRFRGRLLWLDAGAGRFAIDCPVEVRWPGVAPDPGQEFVARAAIRNPPAPRNPGSMDTASWLAVRGIHSELRVLRESDAELVGSSPRPLLAIASMCRNWIDGILARGIQGTPEASVIRGMTLGDLSGTPESIRTKFRETGTFHLFSVSGLHVGMIAVLLWFVLATAGVKTRTIVLIVIPCLFLYALITGLKPASVRAATMVSIAAAGLLIDRQPIPLNSVGAAGLLILLFNTNELFNPGFQLSFSVVATILLVAVPVHRKLDAWIQPDPFIPLKLLHPLHRRALRWIRGITGLAAVCIAAWIGSLPLTLVYFHLVSLVAIPVNLIAVPLAFGVLALAMVTLMTGWITPLCAEIFNNANWLVARILLGVVQTGASIPGGYFYVGPPLPHGTSAVITVFEFGSGAASAIQTRHGIWLIDTGNSFQGASTLAPFVRSRGSGSIEGILITHGDSKHIGGLIPLAESLRVREILDPAVADRSPTRAEIRRFAAAAGIPVTAIREGDRIALAPDVEIEILYPPGGIERARADDKAAVVLLRAGAVRILFLSDAGLATADWLVENAADKIRCDVLVAGRHDSGLSAGSGFVETADPATIVTTVAEFPSSEQLDARWAEQIGSPGRRLIRLDESGAVTIAVTGQDPEISTFLPDLREDRESDPATSVPALGFP